MQRNFFRRIILGTAAALLVFLTPQLSLAQGKPDEVQFDTVDGVTLKGTFYPSNNGNKAPCVMLLHEFGSDRSKGGWDDLAKLLQKEGFAVLSFDFRGHNDSCTVNPMMFWNFPTNRIFRPNKNGTIDYKDVIRAKYSYLPLLTNDVAAAKLYLEQQNDANACNVSNLFIIGAKEGAAIGAMWMMQDAGRPRLVPNPIMPLLPRYDPKGRTNGDDLAGAVWLSMPEKLYSYSTSKFLTAPIIRERVPMAFIFSKEDAAARTADTLLKALKAGGKAPAGTLPLQVDGKASGAALLGKGDLDKKIGNYLNKVLDKRAEKPWSKRETEKLPPAKLLTP